MCEIAQREGIVVDQKSLEILTESMGSDIRQIINSLQMLKAQQA